MNGLNKIWCVVNELALHCDVVWNKNVEIVMEYGVKCDMSIECELYTLCEKDEMWIVHVYKAWLNDDENLVRNMWDSVTEPGG